MSARTRALWISAALFATLCTTRDAGTETPFQASRPAHLRDTGLYSDWSTRTIAPANLPYSPQYPLWSDGARKARWLYLPPGRFIDGSNPDVWQFPVGTRLWKEFRFGRRAETRFIEHTRSGWQFASYVWNDDESDAVLAPADGIRQSVPIADGVRHAIPSQADCRACHMAGPVRVLGVTALQLSPDRDPNVPHAETPQPGDVDLAGLVARRLLRRFPRELLQEPPRIEAPSATARAAMGYLHANCGGCHSDAGELSSLEFGLNYRLTGPLDWGPAVLLTAVSRPSRFKMPDADDIVERVCAGRPEKSVVLARMASRNPLVQMPPLGSRVVDAEAVALVRRWIAEDVAPGSPVPAARQGGK